MCNSYRIKPRRGAAKDLHEKISAAAESLGLSLVRKSDPGVVVTAGPRVEVMRWGFHRSFNPSVNNARSDKLAGGMWATAYRERRCVIPVTLFYEWGPGVGGPKQAFEFHDPADDFLWIAGIWEEHAEFGRCYSMVTTDASPLMAPIHDRMPAILLSTTPAEGSQTMFRFSIQLFCLCAALVLVPACQTFRFYGQAVGGQVEILRKSRPNDQVIADSATPSGLRQRLVTVERIRRFASEHLALPGDESYGKYADLGRKHVVWVLYAAPEFSLEPRTWLYPAVGRMDYRGYFREHDTVALAGQLRGDGYDVFIGGVDAYSTLGWFHDPVLNTFVNYPDVDLAETIFHELTHRRIFHRGATAFNESLANVVAEEGVRRWLAHQGRLAELRQYEARLVRRREFYAEIVRSRQSLEALYASAESGAVKRREKAAILNTLREQVGELWRRWGSPGLEPWLAQNLNNGHLVSLKIYADRMPRLRQLLAGCDGDFERFFRRLQQVDPHSETAEASCGPAATSRKLD